MSILVLWQSPLYLSKNSAATKGFSLIDVLVATTLIVILSIIGLNSHIKSKDKALKSIVQTDVANAVLQVKIYQMEHHVLPDDLIIIPERIPKPELEGKKLVAVSANNEVDLFYSKQGDSFCIAGSHKGISQEGIHVIYDSRIDKQVDTQDGANEVCEFDSTIATSSSSSSSSSATPTTTPSPSATPTTTPSPSPSPSSMILLPTWPDIRNNLTRIINPNANGGFVAQQPQGPNDGLTTGEPALLQNMTPTNSGVFEMKGVTVIGKTPTQTSGGWGIVIQGRGEKQTFSGYTIQIERNFCNGSPCVILREWENGKEKGPTNRTPLPSDFDFAQKSDYTVSVNGKNASLSINGQEVFSVNNLKQNPGVFGVRTWNGNDVSVDSSSVTTP